MEGTVRLAIRPGPDDRVIAADKAGAVKNVIDSYLSRQGVPLDRTRPAPYGFGVVARRIRAAGPHRLYRIQEIRIGSTDEQVARALQELRPDELYEPSAVDGAGLDLRGAEIARMGAWLPVEAMAGYAVSPIRVLDTRPGRPKGRAMATFGPEFDRALNRTMEQRFGRPFHLRFIPDAAYVRLRRGQVAARMAVKRSPDGRMVTLDGVVLPFLLEGPPEELREAWFNGLGSATGLGFGWWEVSQL